MLGMFLLSVVRSDAAASCAALAIAAMAAASSRSLVFSCSRRRIASMKCLPPSIRFRRRSSFIVVVYCESYRNRYCVRHRGQSRQSVRVVKYGYWVR